jgi:LysM repeat protein
MLEQLPNGTQVEQIGEDVEGADYTWRPIRTPSGVEGWVATDWLVAPDTELEPPAEEAEQTVYVVEPGDSLRSIANDFGVDIEALLEANGLTPEEGDDLRPGQELIIP